MSARVMVVDDILPNVKLLEAKLSSEYYDVITAGSGAEALEKIKTSNPDLILLDIMMPEMDGFEVCQAIKASPETAHIPVVMVTALTDSEDKVRGLEAGADDFLSKPINDTALMARVRSLVRLKMALDEWRVRENTANQLGVAEGSSAVVMEQSVDGATLLIVEDKNFEVEKIKDRLSSKHNVMSVDSGVKAMQLVSTHDFDVIVISLNLSKEDGLRLCSHLKSNEKTRGVPILMIGQDGDLPKIAHGLEIGAHDYILRPIDSNELEARIRTQVRRKRFQERLRASYETSLSMALTDTLTGLYNRRYLEVHLDKLLQKLKDTHKHLGVLMLDIDHFKAVNDTHGHNVGDEILKTFSERLIDKLRSFDLVARLGGEEFVVILPDVTPERAYMVAERLRCAISETPFSCSVDGGELGVTVSIGGAILKPDEDPEGLTTTKVLERADKCLYQAKDQSRDCCVFETAGRLDPEVYKTQNRKQVE